MLLVATYQGLLLQQSRQSGVAVAEQANGTSYGESGRLTRYYLISSLLIALEVDAALPQVDGLQQYDVIAYCWLLMASATGWVRVNIAVVQQPTLPSFKLASSACATLRACSCWQG